MEFVLREIRRETPTVVSLIFTKPPGFSFQAGQFLRWEFPVDPCDNRCNKRSFSISSSPTEDHLMLTTRMGESALKKAIINLSAGTKVQIIGPLGRFTIEEKSVKPIIFLTGGVGITPVRSIIKYLIDKRSLNHLPPLISITLLYSNKAPQEIIYRQELEQWQKNYSNFKLVNTITAPEASQETWTGRRGRISAELIQEFVPDTNSVRFYLCGLIDMVKAMQELLLSLTVPQENIHTEQFAGY